MVSSVVETVANLDEEFARIQVMSAAEGKAVVEQHPAVGDIDALNVDRESFAETFPERKVKRRVRLEMVAGNIRIAVGESRSIIDVG